MFNADALTARLTLLCSELQLAGVCASIRSDGQEYDFSFGVRNAAGDAPTKDTMFGIASMSKSITALCACLLSLEGKLSLNDPVCKYLPQFRVNGEPREAVTIRHLCMHTAGIPPMEPLEWSSAMNTPGRNDPETLALQKTAPNKMETIEEILEYIANCPYPNTGMPGQNVSYSNEGFAILSYVIDKAAGIPLEQFMQEKIFLPLGMKHTLLDNGIEASRTLSGGNITSLFSRSGDKITCDDSWSILPPFRGCAMVKSTAPDMATYYRALAGYGLLNGKQLLPREAVELLLGKYHPLSSLQTMCLGINKRLFQQHVICEHSGGLHGVSSKGGLLLGENAGFCVLCNQGGEDVDLLLFSMYNAFLNIPLDTLHEWFLPVSYPFTDVQMLTGTYTCHEGLLSTIQIIEKNGTLTGRKDDAPVNLLYCGETRFLAVDANNKLVSRLEFLIVNKHAWGVRSGTRIFHLLP